MARQEDDLPSDARPPVARFVLLGASNLRLGLPTLLAIVRRQLPGPIEVCVAHGFGRSYGNKSSIPYRELPGIKQCGLWEHLQGRPSLPTFALVTDVGNDLLYGTAPDQVVRWVSECVSRLRLYDAQTVVTELPLGAIKATTSTRFKIFRTIFFPPSRLTLEAACGLAQRTNNHLRELVSDNECALVAMRKAWYGIDPIHVRRRNRKELWQTVVDGWKLPAEDGETRVFPWKNNYRLQMARPHERWFLGAHQTRLQPSVTLDDGSSVAIF